MVTFNASRVSWDPPGKAILPFGILILPSGIHIQWSGLSQHLTLLSPGVTGKQSLKCSRQLVPAPPDVTGKHFCQFEYELSKGYVFALTLTTHDAVFSVWGGGRCLSE